MKGALRGGVAYIDRSMAAYRRYSNGSQTVALTDSDSVMRRQCEQEKEILRVLGRENNGKFHESITERLNDYETTYYDQLMNNSDEIISLLDKKEKALFIWGTGLRGKALEKFCEEMGINVAGVCDIREYDFGKEIILVGI